MTMQLDIWYDCFMKNCILLLNSKLDSDCLYQILEQFPYIIWTRCNGCGIPLLRRTSNGSIYATIYSHYSYEWCNMCYNSCVE